MNCIAIGAKFRKFVLYFKLMAMEYNDILEVFRHEGRLRTIPEESSAARIDLLSNDYMGLGAEAELYREEFAGRFSDASFTSSASRLLSRRQKYHKMLEEKLAAMYGRPVLLFNSGYHANTGLISALASAGKSTLFLADKLIHASSIDGLRLGAADFIRYPHNDADAVKRVLSRKAADYECVILLTEAIFSMDGDLAPLQRFVELKEEFPNLMIALDEAHSFGVRGDRGLGLAEELDLADDVDIIIGTLGKACASAGAFIVASETLVSLLVNTARSFIFSTALPPVNCAWSLLMIEKLEKMADRRKYLAELSARFKEGVQKATGIEVASSSQIIPVVTGDSIKALKLAESARQAGYDCMAIRRPTVPPGGERLRISLNAALDYTDLEPLIKLLGEEVKK